MKKSHYQNIAISFFSFILLSSIGNRIKAQCNGGILTASDTTICVGEEIILILEGSSGTRTWQYKPTGSTNWIDILEEYGTSIKIAPNTDTDYRVSVYSDPCSEQSNVVTIYTSSINNRPNPGFYEPSFCGNEYSLSAVPPIPGGLTGYWSLISGPGSVSFSPDSLSLSPIVSINNSGTYQFAWNYTDGICIADTVISMVALEYPTANAGRDTAHCSRSFKMNAAFSGSGSTGVWSKASGSSGTFIFTDASSETSDANANPGDHTLIWTEDNQGCTDSDTVFVQVADQPNADAGSDKSSCSNSVTLNATPSFGTTNWYYLDGPDTIVFDNANLSNASALSPSYGEDFRLIWVERNGFCADSDTVVINLYEQPVANPLWPSDECGLSTTLIAVGSTSSDMVIRSWEYINGSGTQDIEQPVALNDTSAKIQIPDNAYGNYTFRWKEWNGSCADSQDVNLTFYEIPKPNAGEDIDSCGNKIQLNAKTSISGSHFKWNTLNNPTDITFIGDTSTNSTIVAVFGPYTMVFEEVNAICSSTDTINLTFVEIPIANAGQGGDTCGLSYSLSAIPSITGSITHWYQANGNDTVQLSNSPEYNITVPDTGSYIYMWEETNQFCSSTDSIQVTYYSQPQALVHSAEDACGLSQTIHTQLNRNTTNTWEAVQGPGTASFSNQNTDGTFNVKVNTLGNYTFKWVTTTRHCSSDTIFNLTFFEPIVALASADSQICGKEIQLLAEAGLGNGIWHSNNKEVKIVPDTAPNAIATTDKFGTYKLKWEVFNGACSDSDFVSVSFLETPQAYAGSSDYTCSPSYLLAAQPDSGQWSLISGNPNLISILDINNANSNVNVKGNGFYRLMWTAKNNICSDTSSILLNFAKVEQANAGPDQNLDNVFITEMQGSELHEGNMGEWSLISGSGDPVSTNSPSSEIINLELGENIFSWTVSNDYCQSSDSVSIFVFDIFIPEVITPNGDGQNDVFYIRGIEDVSPVEVSILNRWGIEVYYSKDYQNDWGGTNKNGNLLTNDTYFYVVNVTNTRVFKGFVVLKN